MPLVARAVERSPELGAHLDNTSRIPMPLEDALAEHSMPGAPVEHGGDVILVCLHKSMRSEFGELVVCVYACTEEFCIYFFLVSICTDRSPSS